MLAVGSPRTGDRDLVEEREFHAADVTVIADTVIADDDDVAGAGRDLEIIGRPDVLVVGAGSAGIAAAVAAARRGADVLLVERYGFVGGLATFGLINLLLTLDDGCGTQVVAGLCQEVVERLTSGGNARAPQASEWGSTDASAVERWRRWGLIWGAPPDVVRYSVAFDPEAYCDVALDLLREAGARLRLHSWCAHAYAPERHIDAVVLESKRGREVVQPRVVIDATGDGDVMVAAGAPFEAITIPPHLWFRMGGLDTEHLEPDVGFRTTAPGRALVPWGPLARRVDPTDPDDLTTAELECRDAVRAAVARIRETHPAAWLDDVAKMIGITESRRLVGDYVLEKSDGDRRFPDAIAADRPLDETRGRVRRAVPRVDDRVGVESARERPLHLDEPLRSPGDQGDPRRDGNRRGRRRRGHTRTGGRRASGRRRRVTPRPRGRRRDRLTHDS